MTRALSSTAIWAAVALLLLPACGDPVEEQPAALQWVHSKPNPYVGNVRVAVVERPAPDRARIEAHWESRGIADTCALLLVLPEGALLIEGERRYDLPPGEMSGSASWVIQFPGGRPLDAVVRFCGDTPEGVRACEAPVRLTEDG